MKLSEESDLSWSKEKRSLDRQKELHMIVESEFDGWVHRFRSWNCSMIPSSLGGRFESECDFVWSVRGMKVLEEKDWVAENTAFLDFFFNFSNWKVEDTCIEFGLRSVKENIQIIVGVLSKRKKLCRPI